MNYPGGIKKITKTGSTVNFKSFKNKGMNFETEINITNDYYIKNDLALIYKKPTPIKVVKVKISKENFVSKHKITDAYYEQKSTTDYNGIFRGKYIDFEAKQTKYETFNIKSNLHNHQLEHLKQVYNHGGIAFILIYFQKFDKIYLLLIQSLTKYLTENSGKSQIEYAYVEKHGFLVEQKFRPRIDYLKIVENIIESKEQYESKT